MSYTIGAQLPGQAGEVRVLFHSYAEHPSTAQRGASMNYHEIYRRLIERAHGRVRVGSMEEHHVLPLCLGGGNEKYNLVMLTDPEHFVAHQLLVKIYPGNYKIAHAAQLMTTSPHGKRVGNKLYGWLRTRLSEAKKLRGVPKECMTPEVRARVAVKQVGRVFTAETRAKIAATRVGKVISVETREKLSHAGKGKTHTEESKRLMSQRRKEVWDKLSVEERDSVRQSFIGKRHSPETRAKLVEAWKVRKARASNT